MGSIKSEEGGYHGPTRRVGENLFILVAPGGPMTEGYEKGGCNVHSNKKSLLDHEFLVASLIPPACGEGSFPMLSMAMIDFFSSQVTFVCRELWYSDNRVNEYTDLRLRAGRPFGQFLPIEKEEVVQISYTKPNFSFTSFLYFEGE